MRGDRPVIGGVTALAPAFYRVEGSISINAARSR
jgi:hypothetical protein